MTRYGMLIDTTNCIGCYACRTACQRQNGLDAEVDYIRYEERETGTLPNVAYEAVPLQCMHCEDAPCVSVCPTGASYIGEGGVVAVDESKCIGCRYCMAACPYQVRVHNKVGRRGEVQVLSSLGVRASGDALEHVRDRMRYGMPHLRRPR